MIEQILHNFSPSEIICSRTDKEYFESFYNNISVFYLDDWIYKIGYAYDKLTSFFKVQNLKGYGIENLKEGIISAGAILFYLETNILTWGIYLQFQELKMMIYVVRPVYN